MVHTWDVEMDPKPPESRPLRPVERSLLDLLLSHDFEGVEQLRSQADIVLAYSSCPCGCGSIGFEHPNCLRPGPSGITPKTTVPLNPIVNDAKGSDVGGLILFLAGGLLDDLEVWSIGNDPLPLPEVQLVHFMPGE